MDMPVVEFDTTFGQIKIELNAEKAPITVANFLDYVESGHYDVLLFHRVIDGFGTPIKNEADYGLKNTVGIIVMARTSVPHSATAQFFINVKDNDFLNHSSPTPQGWGYTVFGQVIDGMDVVNQIKGVPTGRFGYHADVPNEPIVINSAKVINQ